MNVNEEKEWKDLVGLALSSSRTIDEFKLFVEAKKTLMDQKNKNLYVRKYETK